MKSGRATEHTWGESKNWEEVESPTTPTAYFATLSQVSSRLREFEKGKETAATQANWAWVINSLIRATCKVNKI